MKHIFLKVSLVVIFIASISVGSAQESTDKELTTESWYTYWGLGYASVSYPTELQEVVDDLKKLGGENNMSLALDVLGFYWHLTPKTIGGIVVNGVADRFEIGTSSMQINQYNYSGSVIHYTGKEFGSGLFIRGDISITKLIIQWTERLSITSNSGFGILVGGGWSFDFGGSRLLLNINYAYRSVESETYNTLSFSVGGLF